MLGISQDSFCWSQGSFRIQEDVMEDFGAWFDKFLQIDNKQKREFAAILCWFIRKARNKVVWDKKNYYGQEPHLGSCRGA